jgi:hypothetical protein
VTVGWEVLFYVLDAFTTRGPLSEPIGAGLTDPSAGATRNVRLNISEPRAQVMYADLVRRFCALHAVVDRDRRGWR